MQTKLLVRNLPLDTTEIQLTEEFARFGEVLSAEQVTDRFTGEARSFGFVEMKTQVAAESAIRYLHMRQFNGRQIGVCFSDAKDRGPRKPNRGYRR